MVFLNDLAATAVPEYIDSFCVPGWHFGVTFLLFVGGWIEILIFWDG